MYVELICTFMTGNLSPECLSLLAMRLQERLYKLGGMSTGSPSETASPQTILSFAVIAIIAGLVAPCSARILKLMGFIVGSFHSILITSLITFDNECWLRRILRFLRLQAVPFQQGELERSLSFRSCSLRSSRARSVRAYARLQQVYALHSF